jgi:prepilin-type N-terminal cleavage/methylation domain-containing protein
MSDFCPKRKPRPPSPDRPALTSGFTLLEVLVVLALVGLLTAFSLPQFSVIRDRLEFTLNRESFERDLAGLSYRAFKEGRPFVLAGQYPRRADETAASDASQQEATDNPAFLEPGQLRPSHPVLLADAPLTLPAEWQVTVDRPIYYQVSGFCSGGAVKLTVGRRTYAYDVKAPLCQAELK